MVSSAEASAPIWASNVRRSAGRTAARRGEGRAGSNAAAPTAETDASAMAANLMDIGKDALYRTPRHEPVALEQRECNDAEAVE